MVVNLSFVSPLSVTEGATLTENCLERLSQSSSPPKDYNDLPTFELASVKLAKVSIQIKAMQCKVVGGPVERCGFA